MSRITQAPALAVGASNPPSRITQATALVLGSNVGDPLPPDARVTQGPTLALGGVQPPALITQVPVLALVSAQPCLMRAAQCWKITRLDGTVLTFTTLDRDLQFQGRTYKACASLSASAIETASRLGQSGDVELSGILADAAITAADLFAGLYDGAAIEVWLVPWSNVGGQIPVRLAAGAIAEIKHGDTGFTASALTPGSLMEQRSLVSVYTPTCRFELGDARCGVNLEALAISGVVTAATPFQAGELAATRVFYDQAITVPDGYLDLGEIRWTSGANEGARSEIKSHIESTGEITLWQVMPYPIAIGDTYVAVPGCDKLKATCASKFANLVNFGGFPDIPGRDAISATPDSKG